MLRDAGDFNGDGLSDFLINSTSFGLTADIVPNRIWLDYSIGAVLVPRFRDAQVAVDEPLTITQTLQLAVVF